MLDLARADTTASAYPTLEELDELAERMDRLDAGGVVSAMADPLSGEELMAMAGRGPGPWVGKAKAAIREAVIEGTIPPAIARLRVHGSRRTPSCCMTTDGTPVRQ